MQSQKIRWPLQSPSWDAIELESKYRIEILFSKYDCNWNCTCELDWRKIDRTIKCWEWVKAVEQWDMGWNVWSTNTIQYITFIYGESWAKFEKSNGWAVWGVTTIAFPVEATLTKYKLHCPLDSHVIKCDCNCICECSCFAVLWIKGESNLIS